MEAIVIIACLYLVYLTAYACWLVWMWREYHGSRKVHNPGHDLDATKGPGS